jgi:hypothetical protein
MEKETIKIPQEIEEKKGCGKKFRWRDFYCGAKYDNGDIMFCDVCQSYNKGFKAGQKQEREKVEKLIDDWTTKGILKYDNIR